MSAVIFNGNAVKALKDELKFFTAGSVQSGTVDPTSVAVSADKASFYLNTSNGNLYKKNDNGSSTNWSQIATTATAAPESSYDLNNLGLATSVAANALTIALKDKSGSDPSGGSPVKIGFRSSTITSGVFVSRSVTSALSLVISSGSTLGHQSGVNRFIYVYALDNAGTVALGASSAHYEDGSLVTTVAEGGAGGADSNSSMYSSSVLSGVACRLIGLLVSNQSTAGTWASNMSSIQVMPFDLPDVSLSYSGSQTLNPSNATPFTLDPPTKDYDTHGMYSAGEVTVNEAGKYEVMAQCEVNGGVNAGARINAVLQKNASATPYASTITMQSSGTDYYTVILPASVVSCAAGDVLRVRVEINNFTSANLSANVAGQLLQVRKVK